MTLAWAVLACVLALAALATPALAQTVVPADWSLKPTGLAAGGKFRLLFLSSTGRNAIATGIVDYNTFVQDRAAAGHADIQGYSAGFRAVGCTTAVDARNNTATTYTTADRGVPIYWLNGAKAADDYEDFYDGDWDDEANDKNEFGTDGPDTSNQVYRPATGCQHNGTERFFGSGSRGLGAASATVGRPNDSGSDHGPLSSQSTAVASNSRPMYGLSEVFRVNAVPTASDGTVTTNEDTDYAFAAANFNFADTDSGDSLSSVKIVTLPVAGKGALTLNNANVSANATVTKAQLDNGNLKYTPPANVSGTGFASFTFKVNDGTVDSTSAYTMTINVTAVSGAPTGLTATASGNTTINLSWTAPASTGSSAITGYKIEVSPDGITTWTDQVAHTNTATTTYAHTGLRPGTTRHYRVSAINASGTGTPSNVDSATTGTTDNCAGGTTTTCSVSPAEAQGSVRDRHL